VRARGGAPPYAHGSSQSRRQRVVWSRLLLNASSSFDALEWLWVGRPMALPTLAHRRVSKQAKIRGPKRSDRRPRRSVGRPLPRLSTAR
jgi:hypothetical protein